MTGALAFETFVATGVEAVPESFNTCPGKIKSDFKLLMDFNCDSDKLWRAAIVDRLSPLLTVYVPEDVLAGAATVAVFAAVPDTFKVCPGCMTSDVNPFSDFNPLMDKPCVLEIPHNVSPDFTTYVDPEAVVLVLAVVVWV